MTRQLLTSLVGWGVLFCILSSAPFAHAYCRTTTKKSPPDYDSSTQGCYEEGAPLFWRNACIGYSIQSALSRKVSLDDAADVISTAFTRWTGVTCPTDGSGRSRTSIDVRDLGPAECAKVAYVSDVPNQNVVIFRDEGWKYGASVLGLTTVNYNPTTGEIYGADMELNMQDMDPLAIRDPVAPDAYDFASVVTHEAGHFLGLAHSDKMDSTMYARYETGQTRMRVLSTDDVEAICYVYRADGERAVLNGKVTQAPQCDPTPRGGYSTKCEEKPKCSVGDAIGASGGNLALLLPPAVFAFVYRRRRARAHASRRA